MQSEYEWTHHFRAAERLGIPPETLNRLTTDDLENDPSPSGAAVRYARRVATGDEIDDDTYDSIKEHFGDAGLVELTILAAYYVMLDRYATALGVELEDDVQPTRPDIW